MSIKPLSPDTCIVRNTHEQRGRHEFINPDATATRWLHYGRIRLAGGDDAVRVANGDRETAFITLGGQARATVNGETYALARFDSLYVPRGAEVEIAPDGEGCDLAELSAAVTGDYPVQFVSYARDVVNEPTLHFRAGGPGSSRELNILVGKNVSAGRLLAGVTFSEPGHWTSWPPHEHAEMLEEVYLYIDMPAPSFAVQFVYTDVANPEVAAMVREGDAVIIPQGYHPNVSAPGGRVGFLWFMAAHREELDRQFGVVNVQPGFAERGSGLEAARK